MPRNVEMKAKIGDLEALLKTAQQLCNGAEPEVLHQHDTFFNATNGRLKIREFADLATQKSEIIFYDRPDSKEAKISDFLKVNVENAGLLKQVLDMAIGTKGELKKKRSLFIYGQTRIHVDEVEGLGNFVELEVCLNDEQGLQTGQLIADDLLQKLGVSKSDLLSGAYIDALPASCK
uniref:CYTH domain-containing protein n=1 Tax=Ditylenchus dipsaci TaxID=166011 RepID=A0A915E5J7_9BILA